MEADYATMTYDVFIDSSQVFDDLPFYSSSSEELSQIRFFRGSGQAGMIVDDISVTVPEPSTASLVALLGCMFISSQRRAKRRKL